MSHQVYQEPLVGRYTDKSMQKIFSDDFKFKTWRKCWTALAESQLELGLKQVTPEMVDEMKNAMEEPIDYDAVKKKESEIRHDVMAHVYEFGLHCPKSKGIIHLGATSMYPNDNTDLIQQKEAMQLVMAGLVSTIYNLSNFAEEHKNLVTLGFTHYQPAQPTTVGKRNTIYIQDLLLDLETVENVNNMILARGAKGTVGTQASYLELFNGNYDKVKELDKIVSQKLGFEDSFPITGQTYTRKIDSLIVNALSGIGSSAHKFAVDLRLLSNRKVQEEPFAKNQTGSSAMAYKRNPMRSERMTGLSEKLINLPIDFAHIHANQWFERTLDDSAIRRMDIPQGFLLTNAVLKLYENITDGMVVYPAQITKQLNEELPFMATEAILMDLSEQGHDRQEMHEIIKKHSVASGNAVKMKGKNNDLFRRLARDPKFPADKEYLESLLNDPARFAEPAPRQTEEFLEHHVKPILEQYKDLIGKTDSTINV